MFVDLVGSTALSARLDPEEMREVIRAYQNAVAGEITRFEGHVAKFMGDGVLAYFGWPRAHEDEAERAVRAGLAITAAIGQLSNPAGEPLAARVGIATGLVVVGDLVGEGAAQEQAVVGDTPNFAARLQGIAAPGQVVIADATRRLLGASFELEDLGQHELKGISEPVPAFAVTGERPVESRFEAMSGPSLLPMVGRDQELALLLERWALGQGRRGPGRAPGRRGRDRQIADQPRPARCPGRRAARPRPLPVLALPHRQRALAGDPAAEPCRGPGGGTTRSRSGSTSWRRCSTGRAGARPRP